MIRLRWFNFDVSRDRKNNPITVVDRILEIAAAMMAVGILILTAVLYTQAPDTVPSHFNAMGEADAILMHSVHSRTLRKGFTRAIAAQGGLSVAGRCRCLTKDSNTSIEKEGYIPYSLQA